MDEFSYCVFHLTDSPNLSLLQDMTAVPSAFLDMVSEIDQWGGGRDMFRDNMSFPVRSFAPVEIFTFFDIGYIHGWGTRYDSGGCNTMPDNVCYPLKSDSSSHGMNVTKLPYIWIRVTT